MTCDEICWLGVFDDSDVQGGGGCSLYDRSQAAAGQSADGGDKMCAIASNQGDAEEVMRFSRPQ